MTEITIRAPHQSGVDCGDPDTTYYGPQGGENGVYLVAWESDYAGETVGIYGRIISHTGAMSGSLFAIADGANREERGPVEVFYDGELDQFLVLWKDGCKAYQERSGWYRNEAWDVWGVDVSTGGSVGDEVRITDEEATEDSPVGAYAYPAEGTGDPDEGLYLVVWRYCEGNDCDVHGRRVAIEKGEFEVYNETITIASGSGRQQSPDVAYQPGLGRWVVVWEDDAGHRQGMGSNHCDGGDHHFATGGGLSIRAETDWTDECGDALYARAHGDGSAG